MIPAPIHAPTAFGASSPYYTAESPCRFTPEQHRPAQQHRYNLKVGGATPSTPFVWMDRQLDPEGMKREKRAERLRRTYEALGKEQNGIFESLAEYTHEVQAEVRSLLIARDRLSVEPAPGGGQGDDGSPVVRFGRPIILSERWMSVEAAAAGTVVCGVLGVILGILGVRSSRRGGRASSNQRRQRVHQD